MKKLSLLFVMLVAMAFGVKAQGHYLIPTVGYNFSNVSISNCSFWGGYELKNTDLRSTSGVNVGIDYRYEFKKPFLIEVGLHYNTYGFGLKDFQTLDGNYALCKVSNYRCTWTHFSVPVMFGYKFVIGQSRVFSVTPKVGLQFGSYLKEKFTYKLTALGGYQETINSNEKVENGFDVAEMIAVEFGWRLNNVLDIFVNVNNRFSFKNMVNGNSSMYNYTFGANVGLKIKVGE